MSNVVKIPGKQASRQGRKFEDIVAGQFNLSGVDYQKQFRLAAGSIFGKIKVIDFLINNSVAYPEGLYIELKWQDSPGSVEEKMAYTIACIKERYDLPSILLIGGEGLTEGCIAWTLAQKGGNLIDVMFEKDIIRWIMRNEFK